MRSSMSRRMLFLCTLFAAVVAGDAASHAPADLVGTWRLVSFEDVESGQTIRRFGINQDLMCGRAPGAV
jgi:hypothetical protein